MNLEGNPITREGAAGFGNSGMRRLIRCDFADKISHYALIERGFPRDRDDSRFLFRGQGLRSDMVPESIQRKGRGRGDGIAFGFNHGQQNLKAFIRRNAG